MGLFSFSNNFEVAVNHPKEVVYKQFVSYIRQKNWDIISSKQGKEISFQTKMTIISYPIDFDIAFQSVDENSTNLIVSASAGHLDLGRSKGIINDIINESFEEQINIVKVDSQDQQDDVLYEQEPMGFNTNSYKSWSKIVIRASLILVGVIILLRVSSNDTNDKHSSSNTSYTSTETNNTNNTDIEPWMAGTWKGSITTSDYYGNPFTFYWTLEISQYGSTTQIVETSIGNYDMETYTLHYDRNSKQLYYRDGGGNVTIGVDPYSKKLYMPSEFGTMYLYKQ